MARIRTVKPEYWTDERVGECSVSARLLFIATWNFADDHGGLDRSAKQLKAQAFPYDNVDCEPLVQQLLNIGLLIEYEAEGKKYLHIKGFRTHQRVEKPAKPRVPLYEESLKTPRVVGEESGSPHLGVTVSSSEGNGREGKGDREIGPRRARPSLAIRLPADFELTPERRAIAQTENANPEREFATFTDYWRSASGAKARKHDWDAAWRNWCRRAADFKPRNGTTSGAPALTWRPPAEDEEDVDVPH
jgi:hypothetical protein